MMLASYAFLGGWIATFVMFTIFGPHNAIAGFLFGLGLGGVTAWLFGRYPALLILAGSHSSDDWVYTTKWERVSRAGNNVGPLGDRIWRIVGWALLVLVASIALFTGVVSITQSFKQDGGDPHVLAAICGIALVIVYEIWNHFLKAELP